MANKEQGKGTFFILGAAAVLVVVVLIGMLAWEPTVSPVSVKETKTEASAPSPPAPAQQASKLPEPQTPVEPPKTAEKAAETVVLPSFDVVRVEPSGDAVIAGRAVPGATIELLRNEQVHARAVADASGLFALVPPPLPRGSHQLVLQSIAPDGARQRSRESVTVVVNGDSRPLVALTAPDKPTVLLSNPEPPDATKQAATPATPPQAPAAEEKTAAAPRPEIKITTVETAEGGRLYVSGQAAPGATVRLYLNDTFIAPGGAGGDGKVSFAIGRGMKPGDYRVRLDDVDPVSGNVKSRAEVPFNVPASSAMAEASPASPSTSGGAQTPGQGTPADATQTTRASHPNTVVIPDVTTAIVSRGDNLWRISRRTYGEGNRFTVIYNANQDQIRDPDLIYPGQVFVLPPTQTDKKP
ncbi:LysM peptidoglycan-binding domain-containing protein [Microvirga flavescens]|uniref:LysM peptidoglycan-binding domain-containing protein n=1 Tax=Microvirga flavescens TaxID=2249811 RepID=UPI000DD5CF97|nr:LysM peptidoglycan-binding domain-containing protein [Microvirga flavescens]